MAPPELTQDLKRFTGTVTNAEIQRRGSAVTDEQHSYEVVKILRGQGWMKSGGGR